jgi:diguanylate cyclase (GGDEF)-like protein
MAQGEHDEEKAITAREGATDPVRGRGISAGPEAPVSNVEQARQATRRWMLAGMAGLAMGMLVSFFGMLHLLPQWLESLAVFAFGWAVFAGLAPRRLMRELEHDDGPAITQLAEHIAAIADGDRRAPLRKLMVDRNDELGALSRAVHDLAATAHAHKQQARLMTRRVGHHVERETLRATAHLQREAMTDPLTNLGNRRALRWHAERIVARDGAQATLTLMLVDLDRFKEINDTLGHSVGDHCLSFLADVMRSCLRQHDVLIRLGGDEFLAVMPGASTQAAQNAAQRLIGLFGQMPWPHALPKPTLSIGLATGQARDVLEGGTLLERADAALYSAKRNGRARCAAFNDGMRAA